MTSMVPLLVDTATVSSEIGSFVKQQDEGNVRDDDGDNNNTDDAKKTKRTDDGTTFNVKSARTNATWTDQDQEDPSWREEVEATTQTFTLCCRQCSTPLGYVSSVWNPDKAWIFWKHRLVVPEGLSTTWSDMQKNNDHSKEYGNIILQLPQEALPLPKQQFRPMRSCTSFLATEMVRYAESKAIFTFVVIAIQPPPPNTPNDRTEERKEGDMRKSKRIVDTAAASATTTTTTTPTTRCILLQLLSWDTSMAWWSKGRPSKRWIDNDTTTITSTIDDTDKEYDHQQQQNQGRLNFQRVAKVVFEESMLSSSQIDNEKKHWLKGVDVDSVFDWCDCSSSINDDNNNNNEYERSRHFNVRPDLFLPSKTPKSSYDATTSAAAMSNVVGNHNNSNNAKSNPSSTTKTTLRMEISCNEFDQVLDDLQQSQRTVSSSYEQATILMKMGENRSTIGLAMIAF
jgi:hypothetical protein